MTFKIIDFEHNASIKVVGVGGAGGVLTGARGP